MAKRIEWIDIAKGIGIILVCFGHLQSGSGESIWLPSLAGILAFIYLFHMPLFYFLGGLTFKRGGEFQPFLIKKIKTLLIPYYFFSLYFLAKPLILLCVPSLRSTLAVKNTSGIGKQFFDVLIMGNGLWFLMAYFVGELLMFAILKIIKNNDSVIFILGIFLILGWYVVNSYVTPILPFQIWKGILVTGFLCIAFSLKSYIKAMHVQTSWIVLALSAICLGISSAFYFNRYLLSVSWLVLAVAAVSGTLVCVCMSIIICKSKILSYIGRYSLVFYAVNALTMNIVRLGFFKGLGINGALLSPIVQFAIGILLTLCALVLLYFENLFIQRFMWWSIGHPRPIKAIAYSDSI